MECHGDLAPVGTGEAKGAGRIVGIGSGDVVSAVARVEVQCFEGVGLGLSAAPLTEHECSGGALSLSPRGDAEVNPARLIVGAGGAHQEASEVEDALFLTPASS